MEGGTVSDMLMLLAHRPEHLTSQFYVWPTDASIEGKMAFISHSQGNSWLEALLTHGVKPIGHHDL